jgi:hypothetical protein
MIVYATAEQTNSRAPERFRRQASTVNGEPCECLVRLQAEVRR